MEQVSSVSPARSWLQPLAAHPHRAIFLVSFLVLFFELVVIRWLSSEVQVFAWLKNLPLMAAFLGLGLGSLAASGTRSHPSPLPEGEGMHRRPHPRLFDKLKAGFLPEGIQASGVVGWRFGWIFVLLALILVATGRLQLDRISFPDPSITTWHAPDPSVTSWFEAAGGLAPFVVFGGVVAVVTVLVTLLFVELGRALGGAMNTTRPLSAYNANIAGSLAGVLAFTVLAFLQTPPIVWLLVGFAATAPLMARRWMAIGPVGVTLAIVFVYSLRSDVLWSPYYRVGYSPIAGGEPPVGYTITVNRQYHQQAVGLSDNAVRQLPGLAELRSEYDLPFELAPRVDTVAVLGAGTGNDAAAALRHGAKRVAAVEIDPAIISLGFRLHDERPYDSSAVELVNTDARAWLRQTDERFDVVSFGLVDSHTLLSSMSSIRLESYLYTVESIRDVIRVLKLDGIAAMSFVIGPHDWQGQRLFNTIERASGTPPIVLEMPSYGVGYVFGPGVDPRKVSALAARNGFAIVTDRYRGAEVRAATDDWPFLYLNPTQQPIGYLLVLAGLLVFSYLSIRSRLGEGVGPTPLNAQMFLMGAAFLLIETKSIAELSLLFGSTWVVNAAVFSAILAMVLVANAIVARWARPNVGLLYALLLGSLVVGFLFPVSSLNALGLLERAVVGSVISALPIAFSGVVFATAFRSAPRASTALGWNLFGAIIGGVLEASSMWLGIKALSLIAAALYGCSWAAFAMRSRQRSERLAPLVEREVRGAEQATEAAAGRGALG